VHTAQAVCDLAEFLGVEMPLCHSVNQILTGQAHMDPVVQELLARPICEEV